VSFTDIIQFFGPGSVPVVVAGTVLAVFELGERFASQQAKDALSKWLLTFDVQKAKVLPDGTQELFEKIFGERHLSLKCFIRSAVFSLGALAFVAIVILLINPNSELFSTDIVILMINPYGYVGDALLFYGWAYFALGWAFFALWLLWSIVIDYISLFKTRFVLRLLLRLHRRTMILTIAILVVDYISYHLIFDVGLSLFYPAASAFYDVSYSAFDDTTIGYWKRVIWDASHYDFRELLAVPIMEDPLIVVLFWAGFAPSIWMWLYVLALFVTRLLLRSEKLVNWLRWALYNEKNPFRSIGAVAAILAFIGSVVIILVSAEISRITAS
jgi:hypothetical protein